MERREYRRRPSRGPELSPAAIRRLVAGGVILAVIVAAGLTMMYQVEAQEEGVVLRFGRYLKTSPPGLHWRLPFGIDRVQTVPSALVKKQDFGHISDDVASRRQRRSASDPSLKNVSLMLTGDLNIVEVPWTVQYRIKNSREFLFNVRNPDETLRDISEAAMRLVVGDHSITDILTEKRSDIELEVAELIRTTLDQYRAGIEIHALNIQNVTPPESVKAAFDDVTAARLEKETEINEAQQEYFKVIPEARGEAQQMEREAEGYYARRVNEAHGDVARFLALFEEYQRAPEVTRTRLYLEVISEVLPQIHHIYVVDDDQQGPLQVLDLKQGAAAARSRTTTESRVGGLHGRSARSGEGTQSTRQTTGRRAQ